MEGAEAALALPRRHGAAQLVGLARGEVGGEHGDLHHLLLEDGHALGAHQRGLQFLGAIDGFGGQPAVAQEGVHHAALDGPGAHDGDLDHQVVVTTRLQPRQHAHLRAAFDLEHAHRVGGTDHVEGGLVVVGDARQLEALPQLGANELHRPLQRAEHAQGQDVHLDQAQRVQVVLVPLDDAAVGHRSVLHRHQARQVVARDDEAAGVLAQVPREADQLLRQLHPQPAQRRFGVEAVFAQPLGADLAAVEPLGRLRDRIDAVQIDAQGAAHVAQCAARPVADDHRGQRGAVAAVLLVDVLDDFFTPLVLEVDVDVGRLVALGADEAAEQQRGAARVDLGHAQAVAHQRIGRAAAALAQDALRARPVHDVGHGEEIGLVLQLCDQRQFLVQRGAVRRRHARRKAPLHAGFGQRAQPARRRVAGGHDLLGVLVAQLVQREGASPGDVQRGGQPFGRVQRGQALARAQVRLGIGLQAEAAFGHRRVQARGGQHVLQRLARACMHQHGAGRHQAQAGALRHALRHVGQVRVVHLVQQFHRDEGALHAKPGLQPHGVGEHRLEALQRAGQQQRDAVGQAGQVRGMRHAPFHVGRVRQVSPLGRAAPRHRDPLRQVAVAAACLRQQHQPRARRRVGPALDGRVGELHLGADDQVQPQALGLGVRAHHAGQRTLVGERQRTVTQRLRARDQFLGVRGAAEEAEVAAAVQLGVGGEHGVAVGITPPAWHRAGCAPRRRPPRARGCRSSSC